jgi:hypothetical protein
MSTMEKCREYPVVPSANLWLGMDPGDRRRLACGHGVLAAIIANTIVFIYRVRTGCDIRSATMTFLVWLTILAGALIAICWMTGERPRWRWGI